MLWYFAHENRLNLRMNRYNSRSMRSRPFTCGK